jgi:hypothetical protein
MKYISLLLIYEDIHGIKLIADVLLVLNQEVTQMLFNTILLLQLMLVYIKVGIEVDWIVD